MATHSDENFADRLIRRVRTLRHPLCVGIDPYLDRIPPLFRRGTMAPSARDTADAVEEFCTHAIDLVAERVAIIKPQIALFEMLGWRGMRVLEHIVHHAHARHLLVLLDAKRGDIADTADGYARAYLAPDATVPVDAMTVNPYLGPDAVAPFVAAAEQTHRGVVVLVRNSNPGAATYQRLDTGEGRVFEVVAGSLSDPEARLLGRTTPWSSLGVTVGATSPADSQRVRDLLPHALFLVLGYGAQGARASDAVRGFVPGPAGLEGGIVSTSRAVLFPAAGDTDSASRWEAAVLDALTRASHELGEAVGR
ncbi:MAG TPA: orotidine-5'-phosphate decarboxylase [Candidatus Binatia bacterium]|nr:orotidine-5'-phosphate decarboxylase [Candidatus Binatia bacterium]